MVIIRAGYTRRRQNRVRVKVAIKSEAIEEGKSAEKAESEAESKEEIQYGADPKLKSDEKKLRKWKKNSFKIW